MKNYVQIFLMLLLLPSIGYGQFAIIADKDGYTNVRNEPKPGNNIITQLQNGHMVFCLGNTGNWTNIDFTINDTDGFGYVYKDRYKWISDYPSIPLTKNEDSVVILSRDSIHITITAKGFSREKHSIGYYKTDSSLIEFIDNKKIWGTDGNMPRHEYSTITVKVGNQVIKMPPSAFENLYEPSLFNSLANFDTQANTLYIQSMNSDGAGGYFVIWKIKNGKYVGRFIAYGF